MAYILRSALPEDEPVLASMLYLAIYTPPGMPLPPLGITQQPELRRYVEGWGRPGDLGLLAVDSATSQAAGAAWLRSFPSQNPGYGYVSSEIPELTLAVRPEYRGAGLGTRLLAHLIAAARRQYAAISLSVNGANPARRLYERFGFQAVQEAQGTLTMLLRLDGEQLHPQMEAARAAVEVIPGSAALDGQEFGGWWIGDLEAWSAQAGRDYNRFHQALRTSRRVEVKWGVHPAGQARTAGWATPTEKITLSVLVRGEFTLRFLEAGAAEFWVEHTLREEGDYVIWSEAVPHTWQAGQDSVVLTVRWSEAAG